MEEEGTEKKTERQRTLGLGGSSGGGPRRFSPGRGPWGREAALGEDPGISLLGSPRDAHFGKTTKINTVA